MYQIDAEARIDDVGELKDRGAFWQSVTTSMSPWPN
jgi:hypothetical protein